MKATSVLRIGRLVPTACALLLMISGFPRIACAGDYLGASAVLHEVEERSAKPGEKPERDPQSILRDDLKAFSQTSTNLSPADAAKGWLELADRAAKIQQQAGQNYNPGIVQIEPDDLLNALPPPAAWGELSKAIVARPAAKGGMDIRESGLRLLAATLTGDVEWRKREIAALQITAETAGPPTSILCQNVLSQLAQAMLALSDNPDVVLAALERQLASSRGGNVQSLQVPNLVSQVGAAKAEAFLREALVAAGVTLQFTAPNETSRLAQKLALELVDQLKTPQWELVNSLDAVELYEALDKRFGAPTNSPASLTSVTMVIPDIPNVGLNNGMPNPNQEVAQVYYMLGLISRGRTADGGVVAKKLSSQDRQYMFDEAFKAMKNAGYAAALDDFLHELLSQYPALPFWDEYVQLAADAGQTDRMLGLVRATIAREDLSVGKKASLQQILLKALLAADNVDEAVDEMRRLSALDAPSQGSDRYNAGQLGVMMARIGVLLKKPDWADEGITIAKKWLATPAGQSLSDGTAQSVLESLAQTLFELNRGPEAEAVFTDALAAAIRARNTQVAAAGYEWGGDPARQILGGLAVLYHKAGRYNDVLDLLQQSPDWGAKDLSRLFDLDTWGNQVGVMWLHTGSSPLPIPYLAANALLATGQKEQAQRITDALLDRYPGLDRGYELLIALRGTNAIPRLDEIFARDQFEERPLIWKAHLLRQEGELEQAEKVIRQAITIDPSDGEEGRGDRMRAYAELADTRQAQSDIKEADFYREVVRAIRLSEDADQFYTAGLLKRAIAMYEEGLSHFSDAYCIQSRLAIQLAALGRNQEAEEHYRRAYELMPDSFGRVESHCFGCERAFDGERAQGIAEKVFTKLAADRPDKPQVHYLLGYLRQEEERYNEAETNYLTAVRLDPDYLNAWVKLQEVGENVLVSSKQRDEIVFNILGLDPLQRHAHPSFDRVSDITGLWNAVSAAASHQLTPATDLLTLSASKSALEKKASSSGADSMQAQIMERMEAQRADMEGQSLSPARAVAGTPFVRAAGQMILGADQGAGGE
jgi:tetratricopeptide (TPR) repeat protein